MAASTNYALARRAVRAASFLEFWAKELRSEMAKQNIELAAGAMIDKEETITLPREIINSMVLSMIERARDIRQFKAPKGA